MIPDGEALPLVSVVIPVHNGGRHLAACIESVLAQSYQPLDILVVNDGSTDDSGAVVRRFAGIRHFEQSHQGAAAARNAGVMAARAAFIAFHDADDLCVPERIALQMAVLSAGPELGFCLARLQDFVDPGEGCSGVAASVDISRPRAGFISSGLFRAATLQQVGPFSTAFRRGEDIDWLLRAEEQAVPSAMIIRPLILRRLHRTNLSGDVAASHADLLRVIRGRLARTRLRAGTGTN